MPYAIHDRFVMSGSIGIGADADDWSCAINGTFMSNTGTAAQYDAWLAAVVGPVSTWFGLAANKMRNDATITKLSLNQVGPNGKYVDPNHPHSRSVASVQGGVAAAIPTFIMSAVSWRTAATGKLAAKGRNYFPTAPRAVSDNGDRISSTDAVALANAGASLINLLKTTYASSLYFVPAVASSQGPIFNITSVRVGDVLDVQRRRKNKLREAYSVNTTAISS